MFDFMKRVTLYPHASVYLERLASLEADRARDAESRLAALEQQMPVSCAVCEELAFQDDMIRLKPPLTYWWSGAIDTQPAYYLHKNCIKGSRYDRRTLDQKDKYKCTIYQNPARSKITRIRQERRTPGGKKGRGAIRP